MRRISIVLLTLISLTTIASAQNPVVVNPAPAPGGVGVASSLIGSFASAASAENVVARMMSFDRDRDGKISASELPERMQGLVARGDASGDGTLDNAEIAKLANAPPPQDARAFIHPGGYTFGDQVGLSSRAHVEGALEDLRLPAATKEQALAAARAFMDGLELDATADLLSEIKHLLTTEQLAALKAAVLKGGARRVLTVTDSQSGAVRTTVIPSSPELQLAQFRLPPFGNQQAMAAVERFKSRLRPGDDERAALLEEMKGILSDEERDNFRAALERRPLVKSGARAFFAFSDVVKVSGELRREVIVPTPREPEPGR